MCLSLSRLARLPSFAHLQFCIFGETHGAGDSEVMFSFFESFTLFPCPFSVLAIALFIYYTSVAAGTELGEK